MGCWGITAFESDAGLDAVAYIRHNLPKDGQVELVQIIKAFQADENGKWYIPDVLDGNSHTGPMALTEIMMKFIDGDISDLDYDEDWAVDDNKFSNLSSFAADKESIRWLRNYITETLEQRIKHSDILKKNSKDDWDQFGGWFREEDWNGWQSYMKALACRLDTLLACPGNHIELIQPQEQIQSPIMGFQ
jgi:hypothetical protein